MEHVSKTQYYLKVKKPLLERQRRARINKCLDLMKNIIAELQSDDAILRMDKADMLEAAITHLRHMKSTGRQLREFPVDNFRNGYINAANEVSRVLASTRVMSAELGKTVMTHLGGQLNRLQEMHREQLKATAGPLNENTSVLHSPTSSGYHSDMGSPVNSPIATDTMCEKLWRPW